MVVFPSGWTVCWIFFAGNVSCVDRDVFRFRDAVDVLEDVVGGPVSTPAFPPTFDNPHVVAENLDMGTSWSRGGKSEDEEQEADCPCPANVPAVSFPAR